MDPSRELEAFSKLKQMCPDSIRDRHASLSKAYENLIFINDQIFSKGTLYQRGTDIGKKYRFFAPKSMRI
jgi:hypothetical protein